MRLEPFTRYQVRVVARNAVGESAPSETTDYVTTACEGETRLLSSEISEELENIQLKIW